MKLEAIRQDILRCNITPDFKQLPFSDADNLPKSEGLYGIWQLEQCIYVGQGAGCSGIRGRFVPHHKNKAYGTCGTTSVDPSAWQSGRAETWWCPKEWHIEYFLCESAVHRTYLEGAMLLVLKPWCNDESFEDRKHQ